MTNPPARAPSHRALPSGTALGGVRDSYASWLALDQQHVREYREEDPADIRALQIVLRMERGATVDWYAAVELAASGCARLCLDQRTEPEGPWYEAVRSYAAGHIRKITRRARASHWSAAAKLPGITVSRGETELRILVPDRTAELDKRIARLQVGGTDAPRTEPHNSDAPAGGHLVMYTAPSLAMTLGKTMAQAGHAGMIAAALMAADDPATLGDWYSRGCPVDVRPTPSADWRNYAAQLRNPRQAWDSHRLLAVRDAGFTEIDAGTITVIARAPR